MLLLQNLFGELFSLPRSVLFFCLLLISYCLCFQSQWPRGIWLAPACCSTRTNRSKLKSRGGAPRCSCPQYRSSPEAAASTVDGCFYAERSWSACSGRPNSQNSRPGLFLKEGSGFPRCLFGLDLPGIAR